MDGLLIYVYHCKECQTHTDVIKSLSQLDDEERCPQGHTMNRTISWVGQMKPGDLSFKSDYYQAFGKVITNPSQLKDELKKEKYERGIELVEVGNERPVYTPKTQKIDYEAAGRELHRRLKRG